MAVPGIVFTGGKGPQADVLRKLLPAVDGFTAVAADSGLLLAMACGIRPVRVVGDMDSLGEHRRLLRRFPPEAVLRHRPDKDSTDTELAIEVLRDLGCDEISIAGGGGGRLAHTLGIRDLFERERFPRRWITARDDVHCVDAAEAPEFSAEYTGAVSVFALGEGPRLAESTGLRWPLADVDWKRGVYGISNEASGGTVTVRAVRGRFLVILEGICQRL